MTGNNEVSECLRVGEVASKTGLTVRTLHHYESVGLVTPSRRSDAGHRIYDSNAVERLYRVSMLRSLGLPLNQIRAAIDGGSPKLLDALAEHLNLVDARAAQLQHVRARLNRLVERLEDDQSAQHDLMDLVQDAMKLAPIAERRISILVYADLEAACHYLVDVFGFLPGDLTRDGDGVVVHAVLQTGDGELWLHAESEQFGLASPRHLGGATATMAVLVENVDAHHVIAVEKGADVRYGPIDQPYGFRECGAVDLEGHLWSFMQPLE